jgi:hypothetical protein
MIHGAAPSYIIHSSSVQSRKARYHIHVRILILLNLRIDHISINLMLKDFSIALNRGSDSAEANSTYDPNLGYLAFGGKVPESSVPVTERSITVPIQTVEAQSGTASYGFYSVNVDAYTFPGSSQLYTSVQAVLDSGTTLLTAPTHFAKGESKLFCFFYVPPRFSYIT